MGVNLEAIINHNFSIEELELIPKKLMGEKYTIFNERAKVPLKEGNKEKAYLVMPFLKECYSDFNPLKWEIEKPYKSIEEQLNDKAFVRLNTLNVSITFGLNVLRLTDFSHRWYSFVSSCKEEKESFRNLCFELANNFGLKKAIYLPEYSFPTSDAKDLLYKGFSFHQIQQWLFIHFGLPSLNIDFSYDEDFIHSAKSCYYLDDFSDK